MSNYNKMIVQQRKWMLYLLAVFVLGAGFTPYVRIFLGLLLGSVASFYNLWMLQRKINVFGKSVAESRSVLGIGTFSRLAAAALTILISLRFEEKFHIIAVILGLATSYLVIMFDFLLHIKERTED